MGTGRQGVPIETDNGIFVHLENHDVAFTAVSRAPLAKLQAYKRRMGWTFPWASSFGSDFNFDFSTSFTEVQQRGRHRIQLPARAGVAVTRRRGAARDTLAHDTRRVAKGAAMTGTDVATYARDRMGVSAFALEDGIVYHTYSTYSRGVDALWGVYHWLDRAPKGRNETGYWWRRHDDYNKG